MSAQERRDALAAIIRADPIASQESLSQRLRAAGHEVTQATVSRDLEALGAIRSKIGGKLAYLLPGDPEESSELSRILEEWRVSVEVAGNLIIMRTRPGSAHVVAAALDTAALPDIAGTIAGDDTLFIAIRDNFSAAAVAQRLSS